MSYAQSKLLRIGIFLKEGLVYMIFRIILLALCAGGILTPEAHAQLFLENAKVSLSVSGGERINGSLLIHNTSSVVMSMRVYWEDFEYKSPYDGTKNFLPAGTAPRSASQWVAFKPQVFTIPAFGQQSVDYTVSVPSQIEEGHYGVLFFERTPSPSENPHEITIVTRVGSLFFIEPSIKNKKAVIQDIGLQGNSIIASFVNQGNITLIPHTTYYIMQNDGMVLYRGDSKNLYVPAGATAKIEIPLKKKLSQGHYTVVLNSDLDEGDVVVKEIGLVVDASGQLSIESSKD